MTPSDPSPSDPPTPSALARLALDGCAQIAACTSVPGQITRTFLSPPMRQVHALLLAWAERLGLRAWIDPAGNFRCHRAGTSPDAPTLYLGSHLDTVPNAGAYDGVLGVVLGMAMLEGLGQRPLPYATQLLGFSEEEGVRYGVPFFGSRAVVGTAAELLDLPAVPDLADPEASGTLRDALVAYGLDPEALSQAALDGLAAAGPGLLPSALGYLELHIEQGPVLEALGQPLGVVDAIAGQSRLALTWTGKANHAGTTPMPLRRDALTAAAALVLEAEALARRTPGLVATVGMLEVRPGAGNVVPGEVSCSLDVRHARDDVRREAVDTLRQGAAQLAQARGVEVQINLRSDTPATPMDAGLRALLHAAADDVGLPHPELVSGAGHDAMVLASRMPAAMLFVRSPGGLSHHPEEAVWPEDVEAALRVGLRFLERLALERLAEGIAASREDPA